MLECRNDQRFEGSHEPLEWGKVLPTLLATSKLTQRERKSNFHMLRQFLEQIGRDLRSSGFHPLLLLPKTFELLINLQSHSCIPEGVQITVQGMLVLTMGRLSFFPFPDSLEGQHTLMDA